MFRSFDECVKKKKSKIKKFNHDVPFTRIRNSKRGKSRSYSKARHSDRCRIVISIFFCCKRYLGFIAVQFNFGHHKFETAELNVKYMKSIIERRSLIFRILSLARSVVSALR